MRLNLPLTTILYAVCVAFPTLTFAQTIIKLTTASWGYLIVPVSINGSGPYPFLLDTGSNSTLVRNELLDTLGISSNKVTPAHVMAGVSHLRQAVVESVTVADLSINGLVIEGIDADQISGLRVPIQGVLGEDFLKHFDILIDNHAKTLTLDQRFDLAHSLTGDHLPLSFSGMRGGHSTADRLVLGLNLEPSKVATQLLIDSGTNYATFFPLKPRPPGGGAVPGAILRSFIGNSRCRVDFVTLKFATITFSDLRLVSCEGLTRDKVDVDGMLPTNIFDRLFISHASGYAIANPRSLKPSAGSLPRSSMGH
jgi:predicted aspartyl protease